MSKNRQRLAAALRGAWADLKVEVKARKWLIDVAIVCPATKSVVARQNTHVHPEVSAKAGEAVKRKKYKGAVQGLWWRQEGGWVLRPRSSSTRWWQSAKRQRWRGKQRRAG